MDMIGYNPYQWIDPYNWVLTAFALLFMCLRAYVNMGWHGPLVPVWWRLVLRVFAPVMRRLDRLGRSSSDLGFRAVVVIILAVLVSHVVAQVVIHVDTMMPVPRLASLVVLMMTLYAGSVWRVLRSAAMLSDDALVRSVAAQRLGATYRLAPITDAATIRRLLVQHAAISIDKMALLPIVWFLLFGITGALVAATLAALVWQERLAPPRSAFGDTLVAIEKLTGFVPNWLAGAFLSLATIISPRAGVMRTMTGLSPDHPRVVYESGGFAVAAVAWGLRLTLGGPLTARDGSILNWGWVGPDGSSARVDATHVKLALYWVMVTALIIMAALLSAAMWARIV